MRLGGLSLGVGLRELGVGFLLELTRALFGIAVVEAFLEALDRRPEVGADGAAGVRGQEAAHHRTQNVTANVVTNVTPTSTSPSPAVVRLPANTNEFVDRKVEKSTESKVTTKRVVVDRENNIESNVVVTTRDDRDARAGDAASEAGTYTIDQVRSFD